jgi:DNA relaxase NicK
MAIITDDSVAMWYAAVDYLRVTYRDIASLEPLGVAYYYHLCLDTAREYEAIDIQPFSFQGYQGHKVRSVAWGQREDGSMLQASSWYAEKLFADKPRHTNVTRLDIAATFWLHTDQPGHAQQLAEVYQSARCEHKGRKPSARLITTFGQGDTLYIGSRASERMLRVYDKYRESGENDEYRNAWRYEMEYKGDTALRVARWLWSGSADPDTLLDVILGELSDYGIAPNINGHSARRVDNPIKPDEPIAERRLRWLRVNVNPSIDKLLAQSNVTLLEVIEALGLVERGVMIDARRKRNL